MTDSTDSRPLRGTVHLVEDDDSARHATARFLRAAGLEVHVYPDAEAFLQVLSGALTGCLVLDLQLPGSNGLDLQARLVESGVPIPVIFLTGEAEVPDSVRAMKAGAVDFLTKTVEGAVLLEAVGRALERDLGERLQRERLLSFRERFERLTPREREVFAHLISGQLNKQVGFDLGISERTIKIHRSHVLEKMEADSIADLVRMAAALGIEPEGTVR